MNTELGIIQKEIVGAKAEEQETPLRQKLDQFGELLAKVIGIICVVIWLVNIRKFNDPAHGGFIAGSLYYFKVAVALAVAAIPEGLPAVITTCLALGTRKMAKERAIIRKLPSVETLGCTTVICSDKTGTLTTNEMVVREFFLFDTSPTELFQSEVSGVSYDPTGAISDLEKGDVNKFPNFKLFCQSMSLNNQAKVTLKGGKFVSSGLPTEAALKVLVEKIGQYDQTYQRSQQVELGYNQYITKEYQTLAMLEFTRTRQAMSVLCKNKSTQNNVMFIKGAPEILISRAKECLLSSGERVPISEGQKSTILEKVNFFAQKGYRVLAIAVKYDCGPLAECDRPENVPKELLRDPYNYANFEDEPVIIGVVALQDPPRPDVFFSNYFCISKDFSLYFRLQVRLRNVERLGSMYS